MTAPRVLVVADYFLPGFRAGGPIRAIANSMTRLGGDVAFSVVTRDHDTDGARYPDVRSGEWNRRPEGDVFYTPRLTRAVLERCVRDVSADVIWLNSFFSRASLRVIASRRMGRITSPVTLAPRGEFSPGARRLKRRRKALALWGLLRFGFLRGIHWIASSDAEAEDLRRTVGASSITVVRESVCEMPAPRWAAKEADSLRMIFASRLDPMKNLQFLLEAMRHCRGRIHLDVIGPIYLRTYWESCRTVIQRMPANVTVRYLGELPHDELLGRLPHYDVMALPSLGENFGHVIVEAWAAGCPVLLSDRTPWRNLAADGVGWDLPLDRQTWIEAIERCTAMSAESHVGWRLRALARARRVWQDGRDGDAALRRLFAALAQRSGPPAAAPSRETLAAAQSGSCR